MRVRLPVLLVALLVATLAPALPSGAAPVTEVHYVPSTAQGGTLIRVEIQRDPALDGQRQAVLLNHSPYNTIGGVPSGVNGTVVGGKGVTRYLADGIAGATADVLGTRGSTGCWDYGGLDEQQAGIDVVNFLAGETPNTRGERLTWSNGRVGMTGVSYEGTTANMVAAAGDRAPGLKAVVPIAAISHWYGYAYNNGVRYFLNSESATDEGFDTPLLFDVGFSDTFHTDNAAAGAAAHADGDCGAAAHLQQGYSRSPVYADFWREREYDTATAEEWTAATMVVHGWNDYNVKQDEAIRLFEHLQTLDDPATAQLEGPVDLRLWMTQSRHANGTGAGYQEALDAFFKAHLLTPGTEAQRAAADALAAIPPVYTRPQVGGGAGADEPAVTTHPSWPLPGTRDVTLFLNRTYEQDIPGVTVPGPGTGEVGELSFTNRDTGPLDGRAGAYGPTSSWVDSSAATEELSNRDPWSNDGGRGSMPGGQGYYSLAFSTPPLAADARITGSAVLDGVFRAATPVTGGTLTPILVEIDPAGSYRTIQRGFMNFDFRDGRERLAGPMTAWEDVVVEMLPEDYVVRAGSRIGLILQSSNAVWAVPGNPMGLMTVGLGGPNQGRPDARGTVLHLPVVGGELTFR
jgi:X-Pro dipeptidyl-peptidase